MEVVINPQIEEWKNRWFDKEAAGSITNYAHFDYPVSLEKCIDRITDPAYVCRHGFLPFIHYEDVSRKVDNSSGTARSAPKKRRQIKYAAHMDSWIFRYYSYLINEKYNVRVKQDNLNNVAVAYRNDLHKNNIHFAKDAYDKVRRRRNCLIIIGDFTDFFDRLDHKYLKKQLKSLLEVNDLPKDYYRVFKAITKYSYVDIYDILKICGLKLDKRGIKELNHRQIAMSRDALVANKGIIQPNSTGMGVPQGSPISAVLANVYMLEVDKEINNICREKGGFYMRYSDDFIAVIPGIHDTDYNEIVSEIMGILKTEAKVELSPEKTKTFQKEGTTIRGIGDTKKNIVNFLGFSYDGKEVRIRTKTISKYYNKMHRKASSCMSNDGYIYENGKRTDRKKGLTNLYKLYSHKGSKYYKLDNNKPYNPKIDKENFIDYVHRAAKVFDDDPITRDTRNHMVKIKKALRKARSKDYKRRNKTK